MIPRLYDKCLGFFRGIHCCFRVGICADGVRKFLCDGTSAHHDLQSVFLVMSAQGFDDLLHFRYGSGEQGGDAYNGNLRIIADCLQKLFLRNVDTQVNDLVAIMFRSAH